jgi:lysophospholipase L1-like esterase
LPDIKLLPDGTHPGPEGYTVWADEVLPLFRQLIGPGKAK